MGPCKLNQTKNLKILLCVGLVLLWTGMLAGWVLGGQSDGPAMRLAGFTTGVGMAIVTISAVWLIWKRVVGAQKARETELLMGDERGQIINVRAQAAIGFAATFVVIAMTLIATVRGDMLYTAVGAVGCLIIAATGVIARILLQEKL